MPEQTTARQDTSFVVEGDTVRAWHYRPDPKAARGLVVVMAHGLGGTRDAGLEAYAERFAAQGYDALLFDYRCFGASDGEPRQLLSVKRQLEDYDAAIDHALGLPGIGPGRVVLWGTSFSGGHVVTLAARRSDVGAVLALAPMVDGLAAVQKLVSYAGLGRLARLTALGVADVVRSSLGGRPVTMPVYAEPGTVAGLSSHDSPTYGDMVPADFRNEMTTRVALTLGAYRPTSKAKTLDCPTLLQVCMRDTVVDPYATLKLADKAGPKTMARRYPYGHFEVFLGEARAEVLGDQIRFLDQVVAART